MTYEEKIALLNGDDFFSFFEYMRAQPRWVYESATSMGEQCR